MGNCSFQSLFPNLFYVVPNKDVLVADQFFLVGSIGFWQPALDLHTLPEAAAHDFAALQLLLTEGLPLGSRPDSVRWLGDPSAEFSVKSYYTSLNATPESENLFIVTKNCCNLLWKSNIPSKVQVFFCWRLFLNRIPSRCELAKRGVLQSLENTLCFVLSKNRIH